MAGAGIWWRGARPRTLPAAVVPVVVGTVVAHVHGGVVAWRAVAAAVVALALQVATNYANDYSDGVRGTDTDRVGPTRLVAAGLATPRAVRRAALAATAVAAVAGVALAVAVGPELLVVGAAAVVAAWAYTGGPRPYGYLGLGELFVFVFFGVVATAGTTYVQIERIPAVAVAASIPVGCLVTALLVTNNLRDIPTDRAAGKRTLAVRMGDRGTRWLYVGLVVVAYLWLGVLMAFDVEPVPLASAPAAVAPVRAVLAGATGAELVPVLESTARLHLLFGLMLAVGVVL